MSHHRWPDDAPCPSTTRHGDANAYANAGCRCPDARADRARKIKQWRYDRAHGRTYRVPALGARRRLRALMAIGWDMRTVAAMLGRHDRLDGIVRSNSTQQTVTRALDRRIRVLYDRLSATPGPSEFARGAARTHGYAPPLAWDNIDDPDEQPSGVAGKPRCSISHCDGEVKARGWCNAHYLRITRGRVISAPQTRPRATHGDVDEVAVRRACSGDRSVPLNRAERIAATHLIHTEQHGGINATADCLAVHPRQVHRDLTSPAPATDMEGISA